jgi:GxxExxY protein
MNKTRNQIQNVRRKLFTDQNDQFEHFDQIDQNELDEPTELNLTLPIHNIYNEILFDKFHRSKPLVDNTFVDFNHHDILTNDKIDLEPELNKYQPCFKNGYKTSSIINTEFSSTTCIVPINCNLPKIDTISSTEQDVTILYTTLEQPKFPIFYHNEQNSFKEHIDDLDTNLRTGYEDTLSILVAKCAYEIWKEIGPNYLEKNYRDALYIELFEKGIHGNTEYPLALTYKGHAYGEGYVDILIPGRLVIELKAEKSMNSMQVYRQCKKYMKSLNIHTGLVINFPKRDKFDPLEIIKITF